MANNNKKVVKAGIWYTIVNFLTKGAVFLSTPLFTRLLSKPEIGAYSNLTSWFQVLVPIATFDLYVSLGLARFDYKEELDRFVSSTLVFGSLITGLFYAVAVWQMDFFCQVLSLQPYMVHVLFIYLLVYPALQMFQSENMFRYKYKLSSAISLSSVLISIGAAYLFTAVFSDRLFGRVTGYFSVLILFNAVIYVYLMFRGKRVSPRYLPYSMAIAFPMIWHTLSLHLLTAGDRIVITRTIGEEANAMYSVAYTCSHVVSVLYGAMNNAWSPWSTERMNCGETGQMRKASHYYILLYCVIVFFFMLICPELLMLMGGRAYLDAKYVLPPVMVACVCQFVYSLYINAEFYLKKQKRIAVGTLIAAGANIGLNFVFVSLYGYVAAAYTTLAGYLLLFLFHYISLKALKKGDWYDNKFNWMTVAVFVGLVPLFNWLYGRSTIRYLLAAVIAAAGLTALAVKRKEVMKTVRRIIR